MLASVLINNYNYAKFVEDAVVSVLNQTYSQIEIILVDDGSTDNSRQCIEKLAANHSCITPIFKPNGGQLSAFNAGVKRAQGEVLFFLDADDLYHEDYIENIMALYNQHPACDFTFCALERCDGANQKVIQPFPERVTDLGYTGLITYTCRLWIGEPTSTLSIRRSLADRFFPIPFEQDWRIRADDCLIYLASLYNGRKFYLKDPLVYYRVHGNNQFFGRKKDRTNEHFHDLCRAKLFAHASEQVKQYRYIRGHHLYKALLGEAATGSKNHRLLKKYRLALKNNREISLWSRWKYRRKIAKILKPLPASKNTQ
ncbi:glycosyltransferase [Syntrophotalea carbinolica DSM 2380]|uniref:Glycosyltransferase n=1 Tax=Syntrophotalea carbinolica (strain DSM 2380 / NBRC 103641 / GraBd1) TaxID=338963 RepID=Q3A2B6_SYNC1|nr:glycosyltransferase family 2 protein [Syntrophotalea carbinolica]ABA89491.1 glycosyltransferase [Syntrophotalea carbinolica DSM 2380]